MSVVLKPAENLDPAVHNPISLRIGVLVIAHHQMNGVGTEPVQFGLGYQFELLHGYQAGDRRRSTEVIESLRNFLIPLMDEFVQFQVAFVRRHGVVVAQGSALI